MAVSYTHLDVYKRQVDYILIIARWTLRSFQTIKDCTSSPEKEFHSNQICAAKVELNLERCTSKESHTNKMVFKNV